MSSYGAQCVLSSFKLNGFAENKSAIGKYRDENLAFNDLSGVVKRIT